MNMMRRLLVCALLASCQTAAVQAGRRLAKKGKGFGGKDTATKSESTKTETTKTESTKSESTGPPPPMPDFTDASVGFMKLREFLEATENFDVSKWTDPLFDALRIELATKRAELIMLQNRAHLHYKVINVRVYRSEGPAEMYLMKKSVELGDCKGRVECVEEPEWNLLSGKMKVDDDPMSVAQLELAARLDPLLEHDFELEELALANTLDSSGMQTGDFAALAAEDVSVDKNLLSSVFPSLGNVYTVYLFEAAMLRLPEPPATWTTQTSNGKTITWGWEQGRAASALTPPGDKLEKSEQKTNGEGKGGDKGDGKGKKSKREQCEEVSRVEKKQKDEKQQNEKKGKEKKGKKDKEDKEKKDKEDKEKKDKEDKEKKDKDKKDQDKKDKKEKDKKERDEEEMSKMEKDKEDTKGKERETKAISQKEQDKAEKKKAKEKDAEKEVKKRADTKAGTKDFKKDKTDKKDKKDKKGKGEKKAQSDEPLAEYQYGGADEVAAGGIRRMRALQATAGELCVIGPCGFDEGVDQGTWQQSWESRFECWWLALPMPTQSQLGSCMGALGLHIGSKLDASFRAAQSLVTGRPPLPMTPATGIAEPGCEWVEGLGTSATAGNMQLPDLPEFPLFPSEFQLPPIPRLVPEMQYLQSMVEEDRLFLAAQEEEETPLLSVAISSVSGVVAGLMLGSMVGAVLLRRKGPGRMAVRRCSSAHLEQTPGKSAAPKADDEKRSRASLP